MTARERAIEASNDTDVKRIARQLVHSADVVSGVVGERLDGSLDDLGRLQRVLDSRSVDPSATYTLHSLGLSFGIVFIENNPGFDWWMVHDEYGRDPVIRWERTSLLVCPMTMISKRVEDGVDVDIAELYELLGEELERAQQECS